MDEATMKAATQIEKLARLAAKNPNANEAASAIAKMQALLLAHNLDMATVEAVSGQTTKRTDESVSGGGFEWQREIWRHLAELNFCMYWTMKVRVQPGSYAEKRHRTFTSEHRLVGRVVNVQQTKNMADYVSKAIERLRRERFGSDSKSRDAFAYREGVADTIIDKIRERRRIVVSAEEKKARDAAEKAARAGTSMATTMTVASFKKQETDANYDFLHGEGASAKRRKRIAEREQEIAEADAAAERELAQWAAANPEEAAKEAAEQAKKDRAREKRQARSGSGWGRHSFRETASDMRRNSGSYLRGRDDGERVGIDPQAESKNAGRLQ